MTAVDLEAVRAARSRLAALFENNPALRVPTLAEVECMAGYLYTPEQVAQIAQVAPSTVRGWLRDGRLKGGQLPGGRNVWRVTEAAIGEFFDSAGLSLGTLPSPAELDRRAASEGGGGRAVSTDRLAAYVSAAVAAAIGDVRAAVKGERNATLNRAAFSLGQLAQWTRREDVEAELMAAAEAAGLPRAEAAATVRHGLNAGARQPRELPPELARRAASEGGES